MENISTQTKAESIKSLQSTINKSEKALVKMRDKEANTTLIEKRLLAIYIALAVLENTWNKVPHKYSKGELLEARTVLTDLLPSIEEIYAKLKIGSPQRTLLERRIMALKLSIQAIDNLLREKLTNI